MKLILVDVLIDLVRYFPFIVLIRTVFEKIGVKLLYHTTDFHFGVMTTDWFATEKTKVVHLGILSK